MTQASNKKKRSETEFQQLRSQPFIIAFGSASTLLTVSTGPWPETQVCLSSSTRLAAAWHVHGHILLVLLSELVVTIASLIQIFLCDIINASIILCCKWLSLYLQTGSTEKLRSKTGGPQLRMPLHERVENRKVLLHA